MLHNLQVLNPHNICALSQLTLISEEKFLTYVCYASLTKHNLFFFKVATFLSWFFGMVIMFFTCIAIAINYFYRIFIDNCKKISCLFYTWNKDKRSRPCFQAVGEKKGFNKKWEKRKSTLIKKASFSLLIFISLVFDRFSYKCSHLL